MANTYSWVVSQLDVHPDKDGKKDVVFCVHWRRFATNGVNTVRAYGTQDVAIDLNTAFTPFADLTKSQVEKWVVDCMGTEEILRLDANLDRQLAAMETPVAVTLPLPWVN